MHAGIYARQGIALVSMDIPGHGLVLTQGEQTLLGALLKGVCFGPATTAMTTGRAIDLERRRHARLGGPHLELRTCSTRATACARRCSTACSSIASSRAGTARRRAARTTTATATGDDLAGDFNGDGVVDFGGPAWPPTPRRAARSAGSVAEIHGAIDPTFNAGTAPVSGAGASSTWPCGSNAHARPRHGGGHRSAHRRRCPRPRVPPTTTRRCTQCTGKQMSVRWVVNNLLDSTEVEIACLDPVRARVEHDGRRARTTARSTCTARARCPAARSACRSPRRSATASTSQVYAGADAVDSYATCNVQGSPRALARHRHLGAAGHDRSREVADPSDTCAAAGGSGTDCQQFWATFYPVGSQLVAPQEGLGYTRQSPDFRKLMNLAQAALDPADPVNFAKLFMLAPAPDWNGKPTGPRPILDVHTVGDYLVPTATGMTFSRAAGLLPFLPPSAADTLPEYADYATPEALYQAWGGRSPDRVMIDDFETEGLSRLKRTPLPAGCGINYVSPTTSSCNSPPANDAAHVRADAVRRGLSGRVRCSGSGSRTSCRRCVWRDWRASARRAARSWAPRGRRACQGAPFSADGAWTAGPPVSAVDRRLPAAAGRPRLGGSATRARRGTASATWTAAGALLRDARAGPLLPDPRVEARVPGDAELQLPAGAAVSAGGCCALPCAMSYRCGSLRGG